MSSPSFERAHELFKPDDVSHERLLREGLPCVLLDSAPMGGGKSGVNSSLLNFAEPYDLAVYGRKRAFSLSKTSRSARPGEVHGTHYDFDVPLGFFEPAFRDGRMLEIDFHADQYYATPMPEQGQPLLLEIEVRGFRTAIGNIHPNAQWFRDHVLALYIAQVSMSQLIGQILGRPDDTISEEKELSRACRYPGELKFLIDNDLPYHVIQNIPGQPEIVQRTAIQVACNDPEAVTLTRLQIKDLIEEAGDHLTENGLAPIWIEN